MRRAVCKDRHLQYMDEAASNILDILSSSLYVLEIIVLLCILDILVGSLDGLVRVGVPTPLNITT